MSTGTREEPTQPQEATSGDPGSIWPSMLVLVACAAAFWFALTYREPSTSTTLKQSFTGTTRSINLSPSFDNGVLVLSILIAVVAVVNLLAIVLRD